MMGPTGDKTEEYGTFTKRIKTRTIFNLVCHICTNIEKKMSFKTNTLNRCNNIYQSQTSKSNDIF